MTVVELSTPQYHFSRAAEDVLGHAREIKERQGYPLWEADPGHVLLALLALQDDYSVHAPLQQLGLVYSEIYTITEYYLTAPDGVRQAFFYQLRMDRHLEVMKALSAQSALERNMPNGEIHLHDLTAAVLQSHSPLMQGVRTRKHIDVKQAIEQLYAAPKPTHSTLDVFA